MRVKGRFVKRAIEQIDKDEPEPVIVASIANAVESSSGSDSSRGGSPIPSAPPGGPLASVKEDMDDVDMPDVNDPDAGFMPTESQPFRRTRRHTII